MNFYTCIFISPCLRLNQTGFPESAIAVASQWTPLGFKVRDPDTLEEISKERFEGTVLKAISRVAKVKTELAEEQEPKDGSGPLAQVQREILLSPEERTTMFAPLRSQ